jgi:RNA polymerase sigma-70 factor, ECF subfamily
MPEELSLIASCQKGQLTEFGPLYDKYIRKIYDFVYYKTHHKETAEDLTSQVFMKALEKINTFTTDRGTFQAWLYQIARNTVIDHYRTTKTEANIEDIWDLASHIDILRDVDATEKLAQVEKYLAKLKPEQRDIIIMRVWQGMSHQEIAAVMGRSEASAKMSFSRAITKLRQEMPITIFLLFILGMPR